MRFLSCWDSLLLTVPDVKNGLVFVRLHLLKDKIKHCSSQMHTVFEEGLAQIFVFSFTQMSWVGLNWSKLVPWVYPGPNSRGKIPPPKQSPYLSSYYLKGVREKREKPTRQAGRCYNLFFKKLKYS